MLCHGNFWKILRFVQAATPSLIISPCFKRLQLYSFIKCLLFYENVRLQNLCKTPHVTLNAVQFSKYLLRHGKRRLQLEEKQQIQHPASVRIVRDPNNMIENSLSNLQSSFREEEWLARHALFKTGNEPVKFLTTLKRHSFPKQLNIF